MPVPIRRPTSTTPATRASRLAVGLGILVLAQSTIAIATASAAAPRAMPGPAAGLAPTIHWEEARRHEHDRIAFTPGDRVSVGFMPRASDRWTIGGAKPRALPAGRLDGTGMRHQANGPIPSASSTLDGRVIAPGAATMAATAASWSAPDEPVRMDLQAPVDPGALRREVFGFLPYWQLNSSTLRIQYDKVSTIAYFGVGAGAAGDLQKRNRDGSTTVGWSGWTSSRLTSIIDQAHATGTRVVLTVQSFAWNTSGKARQKALLGSWSARLNLARQIAAAVRDRGADGVNLDFEPIVSGASGQFTALVKTVRAELNKVHRGYQLTFDTTGSIGNYPIEAATASGGADAIFIMGYDYRSASSSPVGSVAPLTRSGYDIRDTVAAYTARVPASKLILGVPYYGRAWSTNSSAVHATNISGTRNGSSATVIYTSALPYFTAHGKRYDTGEQVAWTVYRRQNCTTTYGCVNPWRQLYVDDARSLGAKYDLVNRYGLRGAGIWALGYDGTQPELWGAIQTKFITDTVPPRITGGSLSASVFSPNGDGSLDSTIARMTVSGLVRWGYRVQAYVGSSLGPNLRSGTVPNRTPAFAWNGMDSTPAAVADGRYRITLWAEDASANRAERAFDVTVDKRKATVTSGATRLFVTPDSDRRTDTIRLAWSANEALAGAVHVRAATRAIQRTWSFTARTGWSGSWDARTAAGAIVADGRYTFQVDGRDRAGNRTIANQTIYVDRTIRSVGWSDPSFDPRAGQRSEVRVDLRRAATVTMRVYRGTTLVKSAGSDIAMGAGLHTWNWDGRSSTGAYVAPGTCKVVVWATSWVGTTWYAQDVVVETH